MLADFLKGQTNENHQYCLLGYRLENTLLEHGTVFRVICQLDSGGELASVTEQTYIRRTKIGIVPRVSSQQ